MDYPFGYGLSYATFEIADVTAVKTGANTATVTATVTNTSDVDASETVQVYVAPGKADVARATARPSRSPNGPPTASGRSIRSAPRSWPPWPPPARPASCRSFRIMR